MYLLNHADLFRNTTKHKKQNRQPIAAELEGASRCEALGIVANGHTPVLSLCRELLAAGCDPDAALDVYRRGILALRVRSIGEAARLTVKTGGNGAPILVEGAQEGAGAPHKRKNRVARA